ncbi:hypothetical protein CMV_006420 [Castanea mollissima]|uniref:Dol-P-Glc:Glc(2)Man(9)GlcNAc(2)-PP-Dol alpha-1,2-glucosyltransferase n=1 Tax=Castanea mollissima TaxID=60419 RepID=A0A8J4VTM0_9ROSI|nr:hypothetical protein CMV_006420 [Castanea mollissima]
MGKVAVAVIVSLWIISVSILVNRIVPEPYMDEIFHNSGATVLHWQFQKLGSHDYHPSWPVGSCVSVVLLPGWSKGPCIGTIFHLSMFIVPAALSFSEVCTTAFLRTVNGVLAVLCSIIVYEIITFLRPTLSERKATIFAVVLALYPLHWFFTFPYYTDVASLTAVLAMYLACLKKSYWCIAVLGALAVVIRQTNDNVTSNSNLRRRKLSDALGTDKQSMPSARFFQQITHQVCLMKLSFVHWNGSVVLGAKEAHAVSPHFDRSFILEEKAHQFLSNAHCCYCWLLLCTFLQHSPSLSYS